MADRLQVTHVRLYQDNLGEYRWTAKAANGEPVADSGEGYRHHVDAVAAAASLFPEAQIVDESA